MPMLWEVPKPRHGEVGHVECWEPGALNFRWINVKFDVHFRLSSDLIEPHILCGVYIQ